MDFILKPNKQNRTITKKQHLLHSRVGLEALFVDRRESYSINERDPA